MGHKQMKTGLAYIFGGIGALALGMNLAVADDHWSQWRGDQLNSISTESSLPIEFGPEKNLVWRLELPGPGGSSPIIWDKQVFVTSVDGSGISLIAVSSEDGREQWRKTLGGENQNIRMDNANSASPSPFTDGNFVWATTSQGFLHCFKLDGTPVWEKDLQKEYGEFNIQFGLSSTPVLDNGRIYHQLIHGNMRDREPGTAWILCFDAATGKELWKQNRTSDAYAENKHAYTSPTIYRDQDQSFLVVHGSDYITGHDLETGKELWRCGGINLQDNYHPTLRLVSSAATAPGLIVVPTAKNGPVFALQPPLSGDITDSATAHRWKIDRGTPDVATPLIHDGLVYLATEKGTLTCLDAKTGEQVYSERVHADKHRSTPIIAGERIYLAGRDGRVHVIQTGRQLNVLATNDLGEETTASPAVANGQLYLRTFSALYCFGNQ